MKTKLALGADHAGYEYKDKLIAYLNENSELVDNILKSDLFPTMMTIITEQNYKDTKAQLERSVSAGMKLHASVETVAAMFTGGVATSIYIWLLSGKKKPADELAREIGNMLKANIFA